MRRIVNEAARRIGQHPAIGRSEPALADARYRFWSVSGFPCLMAYRADTAPPAIVRFVHTARDLPRVLAGLRDSADDADGT